MEKKVRFLLLVCALALSCGAAPSDKRGRITKLAPPPIFSQWEQKSLQVVETGEFSSMAVPEEKKGKKNSSPNTADLVSEKGKKFFWKPSPLLSSTIRVADLTGAALSADGSLAVVTERIGGEGKANSTRVLLFDISKCRLAGGFVIPKERLSSIAFLPDVKSELIAVRAHFAPFKTQNGVVRIDLKERKIVDFFDAPGNRSVTSFVFGKKGKLYFTVAGAPMLYEMEQDSFAVEPTAIKSRLASPKVCVAGELLIAYGKEGIETFRKDEGRWIPDETLHTFPEPFVPEKCTVTDGNVPAICFSEAAANSKIMIFQMPEGATQGKGATPNRLKPANRNGSFAFLGTPALKNKLVQIDSRGNVFLLDHSRIARWKKDVVYIADRAGFR